MKSLAIELQDRNIGVMLLYPGWVKTDMGTDRAFISVEESVRGMINVITQHQSNKEILPFLSWEGNTVPW